jgi:SAM-dependent methyltransferase
MDFRAGRHYACSVIEAFSLLFAVLLLMVFGWHSLPVLVILLVVEILAIPGLWLVAKQSPPFVPTSRKTLKAMLRLAAIKRGETVYDLGCGDGRIIFAAAAEGAKAIGYEFSIPTYLVAKARSFFHPGSRVCYANYWKKRFGDADVVFCYLLHETMQTFKEKIWPQLKPGCRVVSNAFRMKGVPVMRSEDGAHLYVKTA